MYSISFSFLLLFLTELLLLITILVNRARKKTWLTSEMRVDVKIGQAARYALWCFYCPNNYYTVAVEILATKWAIRTRYNWRKRRQMGVYEQSSRLIERRQGRDTWKRVRWTIPLPGHGWFGLGRPDFRGASSSKARLRLPRLAGRCVRPPLMRLPSSIAALSQFTLGVARRLDNLSRHEDFIPSASLHSSSLAEFAG